jgi:hypothetical protein
MILILKKKPIAHSLGFSFLCIQLFTRLGLVMVVNIFFVFVFGLVFNEKWNQSIIR